MKNINCGAKFVRADLHIHTYGEDGSFDVTDTKMTPQNIVDTAIKMDLSIIAITDHNEINNSKKAIDYAADKNILVIAGIEVSTTQGHLLVYFNSFSDLRKFYGRLDITDDKKRCTNGVVECLNFASENNGIGILAHIELDSGFEKTIGRFNDTLTDIFTHQNLYGLEVSKKSSVNYYTDLDENPQRVKLIVSRRDKLSLSNEHVLPKLMFSDAHSLSKLGENADGNKKLTRIKIDSMTFQAVKNALTSHESRVRLEELVPNKIPHFVEIKFGGGILDGEVVQFSKNLTCIIGGRGTGKSTLLESLRAVSGNSSEASIIDSDVFPEKITLLYEDEVGNRVEFQREKYGCTFNETDPVDGLSSIQIESYGQGETTETIKNSDKDPKVLLDFLDGFIDIADLQELDSTYRQLLMENQSELSKARIDVTNIPEITRKIKAIDQKIKKLDEEKVGDLVKYQAALIAERAIRQTLVDDLKSLAAKYKEALEDNGLFEYFEDMASESIVVGKDEFLKVKKLVDNFSKFISSKSVEINGELKNTLQTLNAELKNWRSKEADINDKIELKRQELQTQGIPFDIGAINLIAKDHEYYKTRLRKLKELEKNIRLLQSDRQKLIKDRKENKSKIYNLRYQFAETINRNLSNTVDGLHVSAKYIEGCFSPNFESLLKTTMDWRTSQVPKSAEISKIMSPVEFSGLIKSDNLEKLKSIMGEDGIRVFSDAEISNILERCKDNFAYEEFDSLEYEDKPNLSVTREIQDQYGNKRHLTKTIAQLSLGQQQSILLAILIHSKSKNPLLIDQPEDNLDSEFIYKSIVSNLRKIKENRQVIIVTHNPNITVLGDAELIIPLKSTNLKTHILDRGSIDREKVRDLCCDILEGGKQAFISRHRLYGI